MCSIENQNLSKNSTLTRRLRITHNLLRYVYIVRQGSRLYLIFRHGRGEKITLNNKAQKDSEVVLNPHKQ